MRIEFFLALFALVGLTLWSIMIDAPLEEAANPTRTPNPTKAPWYFLGLQEMLVYFDPWNAGVVLPSLIIVGLMVIPYIDINREGQRLLLFQRSKMGNPDFLLWLPHTLDCDDYHRHLFPRSRLESFRPWQKWDPHKVVALTNVDLPLPVGVSRLLVVGGV